MNPSTSATLLQIIQAAITPVILISGTGMLLLTLTNRMGRAVDRTRALAGQLRGSKGSDVRHVEGQLTMLHLRTRLIRWSVIYAVVSMLLECFLVLAIFVSGRLQLQAEAVLLGLFLTSIVLLVGSLVYFLRDVVLSLEALDTEVAWAREVK